MSDQPMTHAAALVAFRSELIEGGFSVEEAHDLAKVAFVAMMNDEPGLVVRNEATA